MDPCGGCLVSRICGTLSANDAPAFQRCPRAHIFRAAGHSLSSQSCWQSQLLGRRFHPADDDCFSTQSLAYRRSPRASMVGRHLSEINKVSVSKTSSAERNTCSSRWTDRIRHEAPLASTWNLRMLGETRLHPRERTDQCRRFQQAHRHAPEFDPGVESHCRGQGSGDGCLRRPFCYRKSFEKRQFQLVELLCRVWRQSAILQDIRGHFRSRGDEYRGSV